ncbi:Hypothetical predicted protein [Mytilus galloprovincialis]|uniref:Uncharacterized protein n=1 Tax=Mytilus galloprovincialis TaxID=29158 RepID=A0A8B6E9R3_MYTGA|nr:Hypothetical predicted protein [Mytilus galloprovincialis]
MQKIRDVECTGLSDTISVYKTKPENTSVRPTDKPHLQLTTSLFSLLQSIPRSSCQEHKKIPERSRIKETTNVFQSKLPVVTNTTEHGICTLPNIIHRNATDLLNNNCECKRTSKWAKLLSSNISKSDFDILLAKDIQRLKKDLTVNRKSLNSYTRRLTSAHNDRRSAKAIGWIGIIVISLFLSLFFLFDLVLILHQFNIVE